MRAGVFPGEAEARRLHTYRPAQQRENARTDVDEVVAETRQTYDGPLVVGDDLMSFEIAETVTVKPFKP